MGIHLKYYWALVRHVLSFEYFLGSTLYFLLWVSPTLPLIHFYGEPWMFVLVPLWFLIGLAGVYVKDMIEHS